MKLVFYYDSNKHVSFDLFMKFYQSIKNFGDECVLLNISGFLKSKEVVNCDCVFTYGWSRRKKRILCDTYVSNKIPIIFMTDSHIGDRNSIRGFGVNGALGFAKRLYEDLPTNRWAKLGIKVQPWNIDSKHKHIVIAHQTCKSTLSPYTLVDMQESYLDIVESALSTGREVRICKFPYATRTDYHMDYIDKFKKLGCKIVDPGYLFENMIGAHCLMTFSSNAAVDATLNGIPVFRHKLGRTMVDSVASDNIYNIENPVKLDRQSWCNWIAYQQWSREEVSRGDPWFKYLKNFISKHKNVLFN